MNAMNSMNTMNARGARTAGSLGPEAQLSAEALEAFGAEIEALRRKVQAEVGEKDARYIRRVVSTQRWAEVCGRALLFAGVVPPAWTAGVALLSLSKILENMEIGHNVIHGQYDFLNDPVLHGARYDWDMACDADHWRHAHNYMHHTFTNVVGKDRDVGYGWMRVAEQQPWSPAHVLQPLGAVGLMLFFQWGIGVHDLELNNLLWGDVALRDTLPKWRAFARKAGRQLLKDYVLFPMLAGPAAPLVFAGNLSANSIRNVWAFLVIFCGHFPEDARMYSPAEVEGETRAAWYVRQIRGSANIRGPRWLHVLSGNLSHQIEHHLFPDLPSCRYSEVAPEVEAVCRKYGVPYSTGTFGAQLRSVARRILRLSLPPRAAGGRQASRDERDARGEKAASARERRSPSARGRASPGRDRVAAAAT
jgi:fatty acid desaturase